MSPQSIPKTGKAWKVEGYDGFGSLKLEEAVPVAEPGDYEVLVKFHSASLNYRDLIIPKGKKSSKKGDKASLGIIVFTFTS